MKSKNLFTFIILFFLDTNAIFDNVFAQKSSERFFKSVDYEIAWKIKDENTGVINFLKPVDFIVDNEKNVYLLDYGDMAVKVFDQNGKFLRKIGGNVGQGPGELMHPTGFDVDSNKRVWISDTANSRVVIFNQDGSVLNTINLDSVPSRMAVDRNGKYFAIILQNPRTDALFSIYDLDNKRSYQFGKIIDDQYRNAIILDGRITFDGNSEYLFYSPVWAGLLFSYNIKEEKNEYEVKTIDPGSFPKAIFDDRGGSRIDQNARMYSRNISFWDDKIIILAVTNEGGKHNRMLDFYDSTNGKYLYSLVLPVKVRSARFRNGILYTLSDIELTAWNVNYN